MDCVTISVGSSRSKLKLKRVLTVKVIELEQGYTPIIGCGRASRDEEDESKQCEREVSHQFSHFDGTGQGGSYTGGGGKKHLATRCAYTRRCTPDESHDSS